jgi:hypothetical protein
LSSCASTRTCRGLVLATNFTALLYCGATQLQLTQTRDKLGKATFSALQALYLGYPYDCI